MKAAHRSSSQAAIWRRWLHTVRGGRRLSQEQAARLFSFLLSSTPDVSRETLLGFAYGRSALLTPVERLLLFVQTVDRHLRRQANKLPEAEWDTLREPHGRSYRTLTRLLVRLLGESRKRRPLSETEYVRVYAQLTSVTLARVRLRKSVLSERAWLAVRQQLYTLNGHLNQLPSHDAEISALTAWSFYRSARTIGKADALTCEKLLGQLLKWDTGHMPSGLFFHGIRTAYDVLAPQQRRRLLADTRGDLAIAFGKLTPRRVLDRFAILCMLADDSNECGAGDKAAALQQFAVIQIDHERAKLAELPLHTQRLVSIMFKRCTSLSLRPPKAPAPADFRGCFRELLRQLRCSEEEFDLEARFSNLLSLKPHLPEIRLYRDALVVWTARRHGWFLPDDFLANLWAQILITLEIDRSSSTSMSLVRRCALNAYLYCRQRDDIDAMLLWFDRLMAVEVLDASWQDLVDTMGTEAHVNYLRKQLAFVRDARGLQDRTEYFARLLRLTPATMESLHEADDLATVLTGREGDRRAALAKFALDVVSRKWNLKRIVIAEPPTTVKEWAKAYKGIPSSFVRDSDDALVREWFEGVETTVTAAMSFLDRLSGVDRWSMQGSLANASLTVVRVLRQIEHKKNIKVGGYPLDKSAESWLAQGVRWADEAITGLRSQSNRRLFYFVLEIRALLEGVRFTKAPGDLERIRAEMGALDRARLETTAMPMRRRRSLYKAERSFCGEHSKDWARPLVQARPIGYFRDDLAFVQKLKAFNFGQLAGESLAADTDTGSESSDEYLDATAYTSEIDDRLDISPGDLTEAGRRALWCHLRRQNAVVLEFLVNPEEKPNEHWRSDAGAKIGTVCFVIKAGPAGLVVRPIHLEAPEKLQRLLVDGVNDDQIDGDPFALKTHLSRWSTADDGPLPPTLNQLSARLLTQELMDEIGSATRLYLCPHRHLYQIPLHALCLPDGSFLFQKFDVTYATRLSHVISLLANESSGPRRAPFWLVAQGHEFDEIRTLVPMRRRRAKGVVREVSANTWNRSGFSVERVLGAGAEARQATICCHGQMDEERPGRARLRLWGGGRIVADDIHRWARTSNLLCGSEWLLAACESGGTRVTLQTSPGVGLSLVTTGASRVTSSLYEVTPATAAHFIRHFNAARAAEHPSAFSAAVRRIYNARRGRAGWAEAAAFVSFGAFTPADVDRHARGRDRADRRAHGRADRVGGAPPTKV